MLTMTENAETIVAGVVARNSTAPTAGLRIASAPDGQFALSIAEAPAADDVVVETGEARIYLPDTVAETLDENVLDATMGEDGGVRFTIGVQG